jgi:hypothetical protein
LPWLLTQLLALFMHACSLLFFAATFLVCTWLREFDCNLFRETKEYQMKVETTQFTARLPSELADLAAMKREIKQVAKYILSMCTLVCARVCS